MTEAQARITGRLWTFLFGPFIALAAGYYALRFGGDWLFPTLALAAALGAGGNALLGRGVGSIVRAGLGAAAVCGLAIAAFVVWLLLTFSYS